MKKIFGGIKLTWPVLIIFAVVAGVYTGIMPLIHATYETSFRDIAISFECWILFGIIIIANSKSPVDSALKCFIFFLISQPLVYIVQDVVNRSSLFVTYYRNWVLWTLATIPMGFIGYYIKKKNWLSVIILLPMLIFLALIGLGYASSAIESFPHHLLSAIFCFVTTVVLVFGILDKKIHRIVSLVIVLIFMIIFTVLNGGLFGSTFESYKTIDNYDIEFVGNIYVSSYSGTASGNVEVVTSSDEVHSLRLIGRNNGEYTFSISDDSGNEYYFEYHYDKESKSVELNKK